MFEVGFTEIVLILGLALLVLGPEKLPGLVSKVGRWTGRARSMARQLRMQLEHEVTLEELAKTRPMQGGPPPQTNNEMPSEASNYDAAAADVIDHTPAGTAAGASEITGASSPQPVDLSKPQQ
jgi:Tat protein translocase TatB subunit